MMKLKFYQNLLSKKQALTLFLGITACSITYAQTQQTPVNCGNNIYELSKQNPGFWGALKEFYANWEIHKENIDLGSFERSATGKYIIPVVVHVLHLGGSESISATQIKSQITVLNTDFAMENTGISALSSFAAFDTVVPYFNGNDTCYISGPASELLNRFEFRLATKDPQGNCSDGIVRTYTEKADLASDGSKFKSYSYWDRAKYFNLWVVKSFPPIASGTLLGYAQFPFQNGTQYPVTSTDGVAVVNTSFGTSGTSNGTGATTTHEAGHWLGLRHIWGDAECGSDAIDDTPNHFEPNFSTSGCFTLPKTATCYIDTNSTDSTLNANNLQARVDVGEMWMNFMDYTDDNCLWMFTEEQYDLMNYTMETIEFRTSLSTLTNVTATGTDDASQTTPCTAKPIADFWSLTGDEDYILKKLICEGADLTYVDGTYNLSNTGANPHTLSWDFTGGTPSTSTATAPVIIYNTLGDYNVTSTATNTDGTNSKTKTNYVHVSSNTADEANYIYYDDFEYTTSLYEQGKWITLGQGYYPSNQWEQATNTGYLSSKCMVMKNEGNIEYEKDFLITPSYDLTTISDEKLYFKYAGARKYGSPAIIQEDKLYVRVSTDCGENWSGNMSITVDGVSRNSIGGDTLYNAGVYSSGFTPTSSSQWNEGEITISSLYSSSTNVRFMFVWECGGSYGNNFYIDQVTIANSTSIGIEENKELIDYSVYPNPVTGTSQIYFKLLDNAKVLVNVQDITGREILKIYNGNMLAGEQFLELNKIDFNSAGIYLVKLTVDGIVSTKKVIIE